MKTETVEDILWKLGLIPDDEGINILTTWKEDICKKRDKDWKNNLRAWSVLDEATIYVVSEKMNQLKNK